MHIIYGRCSCAPGLPYAPEFMAYPSDQSLPLIESAVGLTPSTPSSSFIAPFQTVLLLPQVAALAAT
jgi:hypothetical protein